MHLADMSGFARYLHGLGGIVMMSFVRGKIRRRPGRTYTHASSVSHHPSVAPNLSSLTPSYVLVPFNLQTRLTDDGGYSPETG